MSADAVLVLYAYVGAALVRVLLGAPAEMLETTAYCLPAFVALHLGCIAAFKGYDFNITRNATDLAFSAATGVVAGSVLSFVLPTAAIVYYAPDVQPIARAVFVAATSVNVVVLAGWRVWYSGHRRKRGDLYSRTLIVGDAERVKSIAAEIQNYARSDHHIIGCVSADPDGAPSPDVLGNIRELRRLIEEYHIDEVLILGDALSRETDDLLEVIEIAEKHDVRVHIVPGLYEAVVGKLDLYEIGGIPLIELKAKPLAGTYPIFKRAFDIICSSIGLVLAAPILLVAAIAIKLESPGPVFYRQVRSGLRGREYEIVKLRSMRVDAEAATGPQLAAKNDPRVTRVGEFLRRRRIDEIPQLWNVFKGDMSLVGPRPERPHFIEQFSKQVRLFPLRLRVRPGLTAASHVWGRYDSTPADRLRYDLVYISNMSFMLDFRLLVDTVKIVLTGRGAQ